MFTSAAEGGGAPGSPKRSAGGNREGVPSPTRSCARSDQAESLGTKEETPAAARFRSTKVEFHTLSATVAHIITFLASDVSHFGETPEGKKP